MQLSYFFVQHLHRLARVVVLLGHIVTRRMPHPLLPEV